MVNGCLASGYRLAHHCRGYVGLLELALDSTNRHRSPLIVVRTALL
jgi:hypothetical protein